MRYDIILAFVRRVVYFIILCVSAFPACAELEKKKPTPKKYTGEGEVKTPPLAIGSIPEGTKSLALIVDDPDAPMGTWVHWVVYDIPMVSKIAEHTIPGTQGYNDFRRNDYGGPCPPSGTHRYFFKLYALDKKLGLKEGVKKTELEKA